MQSDKEEQKTEDIPEEGLMTEVEIGIREWEVGDSNICSFIFQGRITN